MRCITCLLHIWNQWKFSLVRGRGIYLASSILAWRRTLKCPKNMGVIPCKERFWKLEPPPTQKNGYLLFFPDNLVSWQSKYFLHWKWLTVSFCWGHTRPYSLPSTITTQDICFTLKEITTKTIFATYINKVILSLESHLLSLGSLKPQWKMETILHKFIVNNSGVNIEEQTH